MSVDDNCLEFNHWRMELSGYIAKSNLYVERSLELQGKDVSRKALSKLHPSPTAPRAGPHFLRGHGFYATPT